MNQLAFRVGRVRASVVVAAAFAALTLASPALAARPTITVIDFSQFEPFAEADWSASVEDGGCGFTVDVEFEGHIIVHEFSGEGVIEVDNWQVTMSYSANGKTFDLGHPSVGPDRIWIARDGTLYLATSGRSVFQSLIGRSVWNVDADTLVSSHGRAVDDPFDDICAMLTP